MHIYIHIFRSLTAREAKNAKRNAGSVHIYVYLSIYLSVFIHISIYMNMYIYITTHTHIYINSCTAREAKKAKRNAGSVYIYVYLSIYLSVFIHISIYL